MVSYLRARTVTNCNVRVTFNYGEDLIMWKIENSSECLHLEPRSENYRETDFDLIHE